MFCLRKGIKTSKDNRLQPSCSANSLDGLTDSNASFLRAARAGNLEKVLEYLKGNIDINISNANGLNALHLASKEGHVNVVTELLKRGANVNAATKKGNTALHIASLAGQYGVVEVLVNLGANVNIQSQNGFTPLYMAAQENHDNVVSFLLANGANQSLATEDGFTPLAVALQQGNDKVVAVLLENDTKGKVRLPALHIAAKKDDCKAATLLLQNDHNPDVTSKSGFTPLHIAAHYGNENIAHILLEKGADVNYAAKHQITPLHVASKWGKSNMVTLLLDKGANIEASTRDGLTPLHCAARSGHEQVVDLLLERGAPILAKTKNGLAPLHMASQGDHVDSARILLFHKAPVDDVTVDYLTALHVAAHCGHVKVAKLLLDRKADANARALNGFTPLHIACKKNRIKVVELLLKHGASIEATTESGLTPLHVASFMGCMNIVIHLIQNGANPDVPTVRGETPLHLAARANQTDIIRILLRNGANVDARAREEQTPLHIAARLGNVDIVSLLLQHGAAVDATTKDVYTALHIAAKEDQEEVASVLLDHGASLTSTTKKGFTPLHLAAKYGNIKVARLLLQKDAPVDSQGKNGVTPLHVASHYDHVNVALLLLDKGASPHAMAKNGYTPLHIAAKKNQMDIATTLLEYGAKTNSESKAGFTPLHLASQAGHTDMTTLLIEHQADVNFKANNGLTPLHLCAQEDRVNVASILVKNGAEIGPQTKAGYTPLHVASHFGQINMVRFLLQQNADVHMTTSHGYTPLHQAAQQGHTLVVNLLLENQASPNVTTSQGQTALSIAQRLGYISVVETLKVVTETTVTTTTTTVTEEKYKVVAPETMQETFMTDSEDEGGEDVMLGDQSYRYLTADEMKSLGDDSLPIDVTKDEKQHESVHPVKESPAPMVEEDHISPQHITPVEMGFSEKYSPDNVDLSRAPVHAGFLVSFMVDARGGAMRGCRHSGVRVIIPPRKASMPMRITCRYLRKEKLAHPPPLMEGEACASRILEVGPVGARFLGPVILEVPHFASLRGKEREITILRSDTGETWREHTLEASEEAVQEVLNESFEGDELSALEDLNTNRITRILTTDFPQYFAIVTRIRQEVHGVGPEGGMVSSTVVPQVQAIFPEGALTKKIRVGLQAQPIAPELVAKLLGNRVAVSPIVTVEPRRRKFHKPITLTIPVPQAATKGMINQYSGNENAPTLRLLCSITGGSSKAQWEDVTGSTPLTFVNDCVSFTTTVSARFWLMDCRQDSEASKFATELYQEAVHVPFMSKYVIFTKRNELNEAHLRVFCMTDDKEDKTLETQENFTEIAKSKDVEVLEGKLQYLEFVGNLVPVTKSGEQLKLAFHAFHENRLAFTVRVKDPNAEPMGCLAFMKEPKVGRSEPSQVPICYLNIALPEVVLSDSMPAALELVTLEKRDDFVQESGLSKPESIHRADLRLSDIARELDKDWVGLAQQLEISESDINLAKSEFPEDVSEQALTMLRLWLQKAGSRATGNELEKALRKISREDIIKKCMFNVELVTDDVEKAVAKVHLDQSGFDVFKEELGSSREASMRRGASLDISYDEQDMMKDAESAAETSSETGSIFERDQISQVFSDEKDRFIEEARIRRVSKTPPPSPAEIIAKDFVEEKSPAEENIMLEKEILEKNVDDLKPEIPTAMPKPIETVDEIMKPTAEVPEVAAKQTESETWPSGEMDTSQVSVSSLPDDEKSETTTATVSSAAAADAAETETKVVETKEWTETDESGAIKHVIQKTTHMTLSMQQKSDDVPDEGVLTKEAISVTHISDQSGDLLYAGPSPGAKSEKQVGEIFSDLSHEIICDQSDDKVIQHLDKLEHDEIIQSASGDSKYWDTEFLEPLPTKCYENIQSASGDSEYWDTEFLESQPTRCHENIQSASDGSEYWDTEFLEPQSTRCHENIQSASDGSECWDAEFLEPQPTRCHENIQSASGGSEYWDTEFLEPQPTRCHQNIQSASGGSEYWDTEFLEPQPTKCLVGTTKSSKDYLLPGTEDYGQGSDFCTRETETYDPQSDDHGQKTEDTSHDVEQKNDPEYYSPLETKTEVNSVIRESEVELPDKTKESKLLFVSEKVDADLEKEPSGEPHLQHESQKCNISISGISRDVEAVHQFTVENIKNSKMSQNNILTNDPESDYQPDIQESGLSKTRKIDFPDEGVVLLTELEHKYCCKDLDDQEYEFRVTNTSELSGVDLEQEQPYFSEDLTDKENQETSVPEYRVESATNTKHQSDLEVSELATKSEHSVEEQEHDETSRPSIPDEISDLLDRLEYKHAYEDLGSDEADKIDLEAQLESKPMIESDLPDTAQDFKTSMNKFHTEWPNYDSFAIETQEKISDDKSAEISESDGTVLDSTFSEINEMHSGHQVDSNVISYEVPSGTDTEELHTVAEDESKILSFVLTPSMPSDITYSPSQVKCPDDVLTPDIVPTKTKMDQDDSTFEQYHEHFESALFPTHASENSAVYNVSTQEPNTRSNEISFHPELNVSSFEKEDFNEKLLFDSIKSTELENIQEAENQFKSYDVQNDGTDELASTIQIENLELCSLSDRKLGDSEECFKLDDTSSATNQNKSDEGWLTEMISDDHQSASTLKASITSTEFPEELSVHGTTDSHEEVCIAAPKQQQVKHVSFSLPEVFNSQVEEVSMGDRYEVQQKEDLYDDTDIAVGLITSHSDLQPDSMTEGETVKFKSTEDTADTQPGSVTTKGVVTTTTTMTTVHHMSDDDRVSPSSPLLSGGSSDLPQEAQDDSHHVSSEHQSFHADGH